MRLTQIKLSGFKSFVDPTAIHVPGNLVGVVGPNGCGKSNIIDAVRWVLGESRASALRGDSMQDVIFNGSSLRPPIARASVELIFDNSLGKAVGQWSQYAEISVRRVLQRDGESSYAINGTHVRRRDVQDIFLGTGLGPRAYAIIEQGMISRIIEARPEDLRVFLEEAAGISKYKERRRETEHRLADTRENLARVNDIRAELGMQIEKLEKQAEVARRYNELNAERQQKQNLLWFLRKNDAEAEARRQNREIERCAIELEEQTARLREIEKRLEQARAGHYAAGDAVNSAQGDLYNANAEVSRLESEIRHISETRQRIEAQRAHLGAQRDGANQKQDELAQAAQLWQSRLVQARARLAQAETRSLDEELRLPQAAENFRETQSVLAATRADLAQAEQASQVEQAHLAYAEKALQALRQREERLLAESAGLVAPDAQEIERLREELDRSDAEISRQEIVLAQLEEARAKVESGRAAAQEGIQGLDRELSAIDAKLLTLQRIQNQVEENEKIHGWIERHGLAVLPRLWQRIRVDSGWEAAIESVLREKLHALQLQDDDALQKLLDDPPPAKVSAFAPGGAVDIGTEPGLQPLSGFVRALEPHAQPIVDGWLEGYYAMEGIPALAARIGLPPRVVLVNREGHQYGRYGVSFHAPDPADTGFLARQREIEGLADQALRQRAQIGLAQQSLRSLEAAVSEHDHGLAALRAAGTALKQRHHERQIEQLRFTQGQERFAERSRQIGVELDELARQRQVEQANRTRALARVEEQRQAIVDLQAGLAQALAHNEAAEKALEDQRSSLQQAQSEVQEAVFGEKESSSKLNEISNSINVLVEQIVEVGKQVESLQQELAGLQDEGMREGLQSALEKRIRCEQTLGSARSGQEKIAQELRAAEEERLECEQKLNPLRDRIGELRLKEQAARMNFDQFALQLSEAGADETALAAALKEGRKAAPLQGEITRLTNAITELGPINMAALEELATSQERKQYLDAQAADLNEALETLEGAIRRIDRETREMLQATFAAVNGHFGELFPALFGGGEARLIMTGEDVLDCGVQVMARPPGKKNSSIQLLSGGEKALTAIALVFSMFQLNPAPFCLLDEVDAPLDDSNTERFCDLVRKMSGHTQFLFISHNKISMELANQLIGVTMQEQGVSRVVAVDIDEALRMSEKVAA